MSEQNDKDIYKGPDAIVEVGDIREQPDLDSFREFSRLGSAGEPVALVTVIGTKGSAPRGMGASMTVRADGSIVGTVGGGNLEMFAIQHALESIQDGRPRRLHYDFSGTEHQNVEKACLGETDFFIQPCVRLPSLLIFGAGHVGVALAPMARAAGFRVTVLDDRHGYPDPKCFPEGVQLVSGPVLETIESIPFDEFTYIVIVTYGHQQDEAVLEACLRRQWQYIGMIGSHAKVAGTFKRIGTDDETRRLLARVHAPIGFDLGGRSPGEIAVSIVAEMLSVRHGHEQVVSMCKRRRDEHRTSVGAVERAGQDEPRFSGIEE